MMTCLPSLTTVRRVVRTSHINTGSRRPVAGAVAASRQAQPVDLVARPNARHRPLSVRHHQPRGPCQDPRGSHRYPDRPRRPGQRRPPGPHLPVDPAHRRVRAPRQQPAQPGDAGRSRPALRVRCQPAPLRQPHRHVPCKLPAPRHNHHRSWARSSIGRAGPMHWSGPYRRWPPRS